MKLSTRLLLTLISTGALIMFAVLPYFGVPVSEDIVKTFTDLTMVAYGFYFAGRASAQNQTQIIESEPLKYETFIGTDSKGL